jgi:hypothetical protein
VVCAGGQAEPALRLGAKAKDEYRRRLTDLQEEIEEAEAFHDPSASVALARSSTS